MRHLDHPTRFFHGRLQLVQSRLTTSYGRQRSPMARPRPILIGRTLHSRGLLFSVLVFRIPRCSAARVVVLRFMKQLPELQGLPGQVPISFQIPLQRVLATASSMTFAHRHPVKLGTDLLAPTPGTLLGLVHKSWCSCAIR